MKRFSASAHDDELPGRVPAQSGQPSHNANPNHNPNHNHHPSHHPSRPPNDDESDASLSDGSSKRVKTAQSFESLFNSESLSDIVIDVNGGQFVFSGHKMIVGLKSERLAALITSITTENNSSIGAGCGGHSF